MKTHYMEQMVGKKISSVILREREKGSPRCQLLISFEEGGFFEYYCTREMITPAKGTFMGDAFEQSSGDGVDLARYGHPGKEGVAGLGCWNRVATCERISQYP